MEAFMHCPKCGFDNLENATMCQECGGVFVRTVPTRTSGRSITSTILGITGFSIFGIFIVTSILGLVFESLALVAWILSLVFGIIALIVWIIGLILGMVAMNKINKSGGTVKGRGFAITGIATSATGVTFILTLLGVMLFLNSAATLSLHKKMNAQQTAAVVQDNNEPNAVSE
jgi:uncharacterized protein (DUF983 family)